MSGFNAKKTYRLGQEIKNGVRYFGQETTDKKGNIYAKCVCPRCGELWKVRLSNVVSGETESCCNKGFLEKKHEESTNQKNSRRKRLTVE